MKVVCFVYNTSQYLYKFRLQLMLDMKDRGFIIYAIAPVDKYSTYFEENNINFIPIKVDRKGMSLLKDLWLFFQLRKIYKNINPHIVHHFTIKPVIFGSIAARTTHVKRIINSITGLGHTFSVGGFVTHIVERLYRFSLNSPSITNIFQNPDDKCEFENRGLHGESSCQLIYSSGVDLKSFSNISFMPNNEIKFLFLSRLLMNKGLNELKNSIDRLIVERTDFKLIIAGDIDEGNPQSATVDWIYNSFNYDNVEWYGYIENIHILLSSIDVVVLPSFYGEGVPHSLTEALAAGKPIITTDIPGCREVYSNNGYLIEHQNSNALYEAMNNMLDNRQLLDNWSKNSRRHAEKFDIKKVNHKTIALYGIENEV